MDDEYFKTMLVLKDQAGSHPEAVALRESVFRALKMPQKIGFARKLLAGLRERNIRTLAGVYAGRGMSYDVDLERLDRVIERIVRGLYWHHQNKRLPSDHRVVVWSEHGLRGISKSDLDELRRTLVDPVLSNPALSIGREVLRYWRAQGDREHVTGWLFEVFGDVRFLAFTVPSDTPEKLHSDVVDDI